MCTIKVRHLVAACVAVYVTSSPVSAQQLPSNGNDAHPPQIEPLEEGEPPNVTIRNPEQRGSVVEKRDRGGRVTEVEVQRGNSTYYLKPNTQAGSAMSGDVESNSIRAPQWQIFGFDLKRPEDRKQIPANEPGVPPPPSQTPER